MYRKAGADDCEKIYELICEMEEDKLQHNIFSKIYEKQIKSPDHFFIIWEEEGDTAGIIHLRFEEQLHHCERIAEIMELAVGSSWRGKRIGKKLIEEAERISKERGCAQLEAACNLRRSDAHRFYMREEMKRSHYKFTERLD